MPNKFPKTSSDFFKAEDTSGDQAHRDVYIENPIDSQHYKSLIIVGSTCSCNYLYCFSCFTNNRKLS